MPDQNHPNRRGTCRGGATQIEAALGAGCVLLVVLLLAAGAGELRSDSRLDKCLANLRQIGTAMGMYFQDNRDWFPHGHSNKHSPTGVYYGGHPGRPDPNNPDRNWIYSQEYYRTTPAGRPFTPYLYPGLPNWDVPPGDPRFDAVRDVRAFHCPADAGGIMNSGMLLHGDTHAIDPNRTMYYNWGTSYDAMYHWPMAWAIDWRRSQHSNDTRWLHIANAFSRVQLRYHAALSVVIFEDSFDSAQWNRILRFGWHGEMNRHSMLFMDGHAGYIRANTTQPPYHRGPGWKTNSGGYGNWPEGAWWLDENDPDYKYRMIPALNN